MLKVLKQNLSNEGTPGETVSDRRKPIPGGYVVAVQGPTFLNCSPECTFESTFSDIFI